MKQKDSRITAVCQDGMVNIDSENLAYANIRGMYKTGDGHGLQLNNEAIRVEAEKLLVSITDNLYALHQLITAEK